MDLVDVALLAKNAKKLAANTVKDAEKIAKQTVSSSAQENRQFLASTFQNTANKGVSALGKTHIGAQVIDQGTFLAKTANSGIKMIEKTQLGGAVLDTGKFVGGTALKGVGTLTDTLTDGAGLVGGTMIGGVTMLGGVAMAGAGLVGDGLNMLFEEDTGSAFFHEDFEELEGYDNDFNGDALLPERFHNPEKEKEMRPTLKVEWDARSWSQMNGKEDCATPKVVVEKTVSQRKLDEVKEAQEVKKRAKEDWEEDEEETVATEVTQDIYFTDADIQAMEKMAKKEKKRLKKEKKRMGKLQIKQKERKQKEAERKQQQDYKNFQKFGRSFSGFLEIDRSKGQSMALQSSLAAIGEDELPDKPPIESLTLAWLTSPGAHENMDDIQKKHRSKDLWGKLRKNVTAHNVVKAFQDAAQQNHDFFDVFDDNDQLDALNDPLAAATSLLENERDTEKEKVEKLRKQLDDYEANLEKERKQVEEERKQIAIEKAELQSQFKFETERNAKLTKQFNDVKAELDIELEKKNEAKIKRELEELRAENEVLHGQVAKQDGVLRQLHREKAIREKRAKRKELYGADDRTRRSSIGSIQTFRSSDTRNLILDDEATVVTYVAKSRRSSNIKAIKENLEEMNDELDARQKVIEMQVMELESLHKQLKEAEDRSGIKPLKDEYLEIQKQKEEVVEKAKQEKEALAMVLAEKKEIAAKHAAEISRLKLEQTKKELKAAQEQEPPAEKGGLFGLLWGDAPKEDTTEADLVLAKLGL